MWRSRVILKKGNDFFVIDHIGVVVS